MKCKHDWEYLEVISKEDYLSSKLIMSDEIFNKFKMAVWDEVYKRGVNLHTIHTDSLVRAVCLKCKEVIDDVSYLDNYIGDLVKEKVKRRKLAEKIYEESKIRKENE